MSDEQNTEAGFRSWQLTTLLHEGDRIADIYADTKGTFKGYNGDGTLQIEWDEPNPADAEAGSFTRGEVALIQRAKALTPELPTWGEPV